ncbi:InlB B-repeat-containing protein [Candidatus Saccharibacteria bacterium]|nr:InlB B-repeat-containing protein [Candidatus Saccharibacteria bacterium]
MSKTKSYFGVVICAFIASLFVSCLYNNIVFAASASISTTGTVSIDVSAAGNSANIGSDMLTVNTTCSTGYTVSISSSINDTTLYKDGDSTSNSRITPSTGTVSTPAGILGDNLGTWGYSMTDSAINGAFIGLSSTPVIIKTSNTASATTGDRIPIYYGVSITPQLEAGTYTMAKDSSNNPATIIYQLLLPSTCDPYTVKYNANNGSGVMSDQFVGYDEDVPLSANSFTRTGYSFNGWNTNANGTGISYSNNQTIRNIASAGGEITLYAQWKANTYTVSFNANQTGQTVYNVSQTVSGSTASQTHTYGSSRTLTSNGFTRPGFRFLGWSTNRAATTATYTNGQSVSNLTTGTNTVTLYAIWQPKNSLNSITNMQQMTSAICNDTYTPKNTATTENTSTYFSADNVPQRTLSDTRDSKTYIVRKLADGNCWMVQNLDLDLDANVTYTHADTDLGWGNNWNTSATWKPMRSTISYEKSLWENEYVAPHSVDTGNWYWKNTPFYDSSLCYNNGTTYCDYFSKTNSYASYFSQTPYATNGNYGHVGNYYNWAAAIASNDSSTYAVDTKGNIALNPQNSICPAGWRLPTVSNASASTSGSTNEFARLNLLYNNGVMTSSEMVEKSPIYMVRGGGIIWSDYYMKFKLLDSGAASNYWTSTSAGATDSAGRYSSYTFGNRSDLIGTDVKLATITRISVRCIAR